MKLLHNRTLRAIVLFLAITVAGVILTGAIFGKHGSKYGRCFDNGGAQQLDCK
jgi:hypothetical protein